MLWKRLLARFVVATLVAFFSDCQAKSGSTQSSMFQFQSEISNLKSELLVQKTKI
jgi:hypothetical protein